MEYNELEILLQRYYDGTSTLADERRLRRLLSEHPEYATDDAMGARAVLAYAAASRPRRRSASRSLRPLLATAASIALLIGLAASVVSISDLSAFNPATDSYAMVDGNVISDPEELHAIMQSQLGEVRDAGRELSASIADDISLFSDIDDLPTSETLEL